MLALTATKAGRDFITFMMEVGGDPNDEQDMDNRSRGHVSEHNRLRLSRNPSKQPLQKVKVEHWLQPVGH